MGGRDGAWRAERDSRRIQARGAAERDSRRIQARGAAERDSRRIQARGAAERDSRRIQARGAAERNSRRIQARGAAERDSRRIQVGACRRARLSANSSWSVPPSATSEASDARRPATRTSGVSRLAGKDALHDPRAEVPSQARDLEPGVVAIERRDRHSPCGEAGAELLAHVLLIAALVAASRASAVSSTEPRCDAARLTRCALLYKAAASRPSGVSAECG